jgi:GrpB-like predicted nucleotidyltransferase (UPF0157 family)
MMEKYTFNEYDNEYKDLFTRERDNLSIFLQGSKIEHVGSTAIPGLGGKKIIDIMLGSHHEHLRPYIKILKYRNYEFREKGSTKERLFFRKIYRTKNSVTIYHLHITKIGSKDWNQIIKFRDYLLTHPDAVKEYAKLKIKAVETAKGNGEVYKEIKRKYFEKILKII